ncbi:hypothetical protein [Enterococcus sp. AZ102]|uniref:hypothetical protein n=1 Tax=Enterococcus sp. AZ102 TaxID=2774865 RepID=UPI003F2178D1
MPKYTVKQPFHDLQKKVTYETGQTIDLTAKRADEIIEKLGETYLQKAPTTKKEK